MQRNPNFRANVLYSRENAFAQVPNFEPQQEFAKRRVPSFNPFAAFLPSGNDSVRHLSQQHRHPSKAENALGGWIRALDRSARPPCSSYAQANEHLRDKYKLNFSNDDIRTQPILPRHNLHLLRNEPLTPEVEKFSHEAEFAMARRSPSYPVNAIDQPIGKFLLRERYGRSDSDEAEFRRRNTHPPAELVRVHRGASFDKEAKLSKAYKEWVKILASKPAAGPGRRRRAANPESESYFSQVEPLRLPDFAAGYEPLGGCCCKTKLIPPRDQISPPRGVVRSATNYHDHFAAKCCAKRDPIWPTDRISPPRGAVLSATSYNEHFYDKGCEHPGYIIPPGGISPPHGQILANTSYARDYLDKPYSRRELIIVAGGISPPHGVVSSSTHYAEHFPERGYSKREMIVVPGGISPPRGNFSSETNYARDYQECSHCRRGYIVPPSGISPPHGHMHSDTVYEDQFGDKGLCQRVPIRLPDAISPPCGAVQDETTYNQTFQECSQCPQHPAEIAAQEASPGPCSDFCPESPTKLRRKNEPRPDAAPFDSDQSNQQEPVQNFWDAEDLANDISTLHFSKMMQKRRYDSDFKVEERRLVRRTKRSKKRKIKVVQRTETQDEAASPRYIAVQPPYSPKPPTAIKRLFATSYNKSYVAEAMRNLH